MARQIVKDLVDHKRFTYIQESETRGAGSGGRAYVCTCDWEYLWFPVCVCRSRRQEGLKQQNICTFSWRTQKRLRNQRHLVPLQGAAEWGQKQGSLKVFKRSQTFSLTLYYQVLLPSSLLQKMGNLFHREVGTIDSQENSGTLGISKGQVAH